MHQEVAPSEEQQKEAEKRRLQFDWYCAGYDACKEGRPRVSPPAWSMPARKRWLEGFKAAERAKLGPLDE